MGGVVVVTFDENEEEKAIFRAYTLGAGCLYLTPRFCILCHYGAIFLSLS